MVKETVIYTTSDGKEYKTKKSAERHENEMVFKGTKLTVKQVSDYVTEIAKTNRIVDTFLKNKPDWRDWSNHIVKQLPGYIDKLENDIVDYQIITKSMWDRDPKIERRVGLPRLAEGEHPKEFEQYVEEKTEKDTSGSTYNLEVYKQEESLIQYLVKETPLTPEQKIEQGKELSERDLRDLVFEREEMHVEEGEDRRWSRTVTTVVKAEDGNLYAIDWEKGLTESQEDEFYSQPQKVMLEEKEIVTKVTNIKYI